MGTYAQGLSISVIGLLITFVSLGLFILVMVALKAIFPARKEVRKMEEPVQIQTSEAGEEAEIAAAIAIAVQVVQRRRQSQLGKLLLDPGRRLWNPGFQEQSVIRHISIKNP